MKHITVKGTHYECGYQIGRRFKAQIIWRLKHHNITKSYVSKHRVAFDLMYNHVKNNYPLYLDEIYGLARGSNISMDYILFLNFAELSQYHHGCSSIARGGSSLELAHNEDGDSEEKKSACALITYVLPTHTFTSYTYLGELPGNSFSWNQHGLYFTVNYIQVVPLRQYVPRYFIARSLVDCTTLKDVEKVLKKTHCDSAFHYFVGDKKSIVSFEHCYRDVSVKKISRCYVHTNHLLRGTFRSQIYGSTIERYNCLGELVPGDFRLALFDTSGRPKSVYARRGDVSRTLATVVFLPLKNRVDIYEKRGGEPLLVLKLH